jgi:flagellar biogenesis protein FliO
MVLGLGAVDPPPALGGGGSYAAFLIETLLILAGVCALAWAVIRFALPKVMGARGVVGGGKGVLRIVARMPLEPRKTLYVVEAAGKTLLVGVSDGGPMTTLAELDGKRVDEVEAEARAAAGGKRSFLSVLRRD